MIFGDVVRSRRDATGCDGLAADAGGGPRRRRIPPADRLRRSSSPRATSSRACWRRAIDPTRGDPAGGAPSRAPADALGRRGGRRRPRQRPGHAAERRGVHRARASGWPRQRPAGTARVVSGDPADRRAARRRSRRSSAELLDDLTDRQRVIARLILVEGLRRSEAAERLGVSRATVSVAADRAHVRSIGRAGRRAAAGCSPRARRSRPRGGWARRRSGRMRPWRRRPADRCPPTRS